MGESVARHCIIQSLAAVSLGQGSGFEGWSRPILGVFKTGLDASESSIATDRNSWALSSISSIDGDTPDEGVPEPS